MNFEALVKHISTIQNTLQAQAAHAVNLALTSRNWLMGCYIVEFEQNGEDRAAYGEQLFRVCHTIYCITNTNSAVIDRRIH